MTAKLWSISVAAIRSISNAPDWLREQARLTFEQVVRLPALDVAAMGQDAAPSVEEKVLKPDYLDFLREQIRLEPRGHEWTKILSGRLLALEPFANKRVITVMLFRKPHSATLRIRPDTEELIHVEID